jgi:hypothetical protein
LMLCCLSISTLANQHISTLYIWQGVYHAKPVTVPKQGTQLNNAL